MEKIDTLSRHGLFDAKVPRYTSYPPANHFKNEVGQRCQQNWLKGVLPDESVSIYVHIPFCKRLCWFCACRTQGTRTLRPVNAYVETVKAEIAAVAATLNTGVKMRRLHLGGGTPTILAPTTMQALLTTIFANFPITDDFEFSVEIDPTEADPELLQTLINNGMNRASLGVQDFETKVQKAIGRLQSFEQTKSVVEFLRAREIGAINFDLLYGLPFQTEKSFKKTLDHVIALDPDRLAIYGYAHVPWMSKRQVMIKSDSLPDAKQRFKLANIASNRLAMVGFESVGIDHFAKPTDSLSKAKNSGQLRRNFQGYTDDPSETLIGFGASSISRFREGYMQNAVATSAYQERVEQSGFAGHKGYEMTASENLVAAMIERLMCTFCFPKEKLKRTFPKHKATIEQISARLEHQFEDVFCLDSDNLKMRAGTYPLARIVAHEIDNFTSSKNAHSSAI